MSDDCFNVNGTLASVLVNCMTATNVQSKHLHNVSISWLSIFNAKPLIPEILVSC
jgi:hypothetical protein